MPTLTPAQAAEIARGVYDLRTQSVSDALKTGIGTDGMFAVSEGSAFQGTSGALMFRKLSTFGYVARGTGLFATEALIATRGTATLADWVTDANIALQIGPGGLPVHAGFNETWKSFSAELEAFFRRHNPTRVHCVGHSLGGALATLNANYVTSRRIANVELYTFGCPRVGDGIFASSLTKRLGAGSIHRVWHPSDPVPMIPLFPFWHVPLGGAGLSIARGQSGLISPSAHTMATSYLPAVRSHTWGTLEAARAAEERVPVQTWLERAAEGHGGFLMGSATLLSMIGRALAWLMAQAGKLVLGGVGLTLTAGATVLDQIAWLLSRAAQLSAEVGGHVKTLIGAIFRFLGRTAAKVADVTVAFLRWILSLLFTTVQVAGRRALALLP